METRLIRLRLSKLSPIAILSCPAYITLNISSHEMRIVKKAKQKIAILSLVGDPLGEPDAILLRKKIQSILDDNVEHVIIDLRGVKRINSQGIGGLVSVLVTMLRVGGDLTLTNVGKHVQNVLKMTNLSPVFSTYKSIPEALKNYRI